MKIYFAASIRGGRDDAKIYQQIIEALKEKHKVLTEHIGNLALSDKGQGTLTDEAIYQQDINWLRESDVVVAETTQPSLGVGYELAYAEKIGKPVIILHQKGKGSLSAMIQGSGYFKQVHYYETVEDVVGMLEGDLIEVV